MDQIDELLTRRVEKIYPDKQTLEKALRSGKKLRLYQGFDPSSPNLHIGHLVGLLKLAEFQKLGHEVIFLIGDFTGMVGDPTGKLSSRKQLTKEEVLKNAQTYQKQVAKILSFSGKNPVKILYNSQWLAKLNFADLLNLSHFITYQQIIKRDMFQKRIEADKDIYLNEFLYPLMQGYDSVAMDVDLEIGGSDQMFNMLVGRDLMRKLKQKEKFVITTCLLVDSQGEKIGKTEGNAINLVNPPHEFFGQIMSLSDDCLLPCFELITNYPQEKIDEIKKQLGVGENPKKFKKQLAFELVQRLHSAQKAREAQNYFEKTFEQKQLPKTLPQVKIKPGNYLLIDLLTQSRLCSSRSEAKRLIQQKAVEVNQSVVSDTQKEITLQKEPIILKIGKKKFIGFIPQK